jgi:threonine synthase
MPQIVYYIYAYAQLLDKGKIALGDKINFCVPTGNFGNILAGYIAKKMGLPINKLICASNANRVLTDFINSGTYDRRRELILTTSPSMDILISSNLERLLYFASGGNAELVKNHMRSLTKTGKYSIDGQLLAVIQSEFLAGSSGDSAAKSAIRAVFQTHGYLLDTHTAVAYDVLEHSAVEGHTVVVSTASPYKFCGDVLDALGAEVPDGLEQFNALSELTGTPVPKPLAELAGRPIRFTNSVDTDKMREYVWHSMR